MSKNLVLIAGIGGASLGTELAKCLRGISTYDVFGCDVSPLAYGLYDDAFVDTFVVARVGYVDAVLDLCTKLKIQVVIPGAEEPAVLLSAAAGRFEARGIKVAANSTAVTRLCADKIDTFAFLERAGFATPKSTVPATAGAIALKGPVIVKPATGSGGSSHVFYAPSATEA